MLLEISDSKVFDKGFFDKSGNTIDRIWPVMNRALLRLLFTKMGEFATLSH